MSYKKLGDCVRFISNKNTDERATVLYGINIDKYFMPSVANTIGVDLKKYKVVDKYQFACNRMHVGRDERLPISMSTFDYPFIVSPAYDVFEVIDTNHVIPEYLMLWFRQGEFDRQCWFYTDADVRGGFHLDALKAIEIEIPPIEKQCEIVAQYEAIEKKIKVNEAICEKLESTAQALYKHWFVDFEFPNEKGQPYKSSGGKMILNEELEKEIPEGWKVKSLGEIVVCNSDNLKSNSSLENIFYLDTSNLINNKIKKLQYLELKYDEVPSRAKRIVKENDIVFSTVRPNLKHFGLLKNVPENLIVSTGFCVLRSSDLLISNEYIYLSIIRDDILQFLQGKAEMSVSTYPSITSDDLLEIKICVPNESIASIQNLKDLYNTIEILNKQNQKLTQFQRLLLSRLAMLEA